jgi:hypothetical protein
MLYREIIAVCSQIHTKHKNTLYGQNKGLLNEYPGGTYSDHWTCKQLLRSSLFESRPGNQISRYYKSCRLHFPPNTHTVARSLSPAAPNLIVLPFHAAISESFQAETNQLLVAMRSAERPLRHAGFSKPCRQLNTPVIGNEAGSRKEVREHNLPEPRNYMAVDLSFILWACFSPGKRLICGKHNLWWQNYISASCDREDSC